MAEQASESIPTLNEENSIHSSNIKKTSLKLEKLDLNKREEEFLIKIIESGLIEIHPSFTLEGTVYKELEEFLDEYDPEEMKNLLLSLSKKQVLVVQSFEPAIFCPKCDSNHIMIQFECNKCQSKYIKNVEILDHPLCGYRGNREEFTYKGKLVCPNCQTKLSEAPESTRNKYRIIGSVFECEKCGKKLDKPKIIFYCNNCQKTFTYRNAQYTRPQGYYIPKEIIKQIKTRDLIQVLLIEDNLMDAEWIIKFLKDTEEQTKYETIHIDGGQEALELVKENRFDVVILDYNLPMMSGKEVLKQIKIIDEELPVIMLTGTDDRETAVEAMKLGASDYLIKSTEAYESLPRLIKKSLLS